MKKVYLLCALMALSFVSAQESFPFMRPGLLKGRDVKIVDSYSSERDEYFSGFYSDDQMIDVYMPTKERARTSKREELIDKEFNVVNVDTLKVSYINGPGYIRVTLQDKTGSKLYYKYSPKSDLDYPFQVIGGLKLPADFYCDYVKYNNLSPNAIVANAGVGCQVEKMTTQKQPTYAVSFNFFAKTNSGDVDKVAVSLEDGTRLIFDTTCYPLQHSKDSYKYSFTIIIYGKNLAAVKKSKIVGLKVGNKAGEGVWAFEGQKLMGMINCMETMK